MVRCPRTFHTKAIMDMQTGSEGMKGTAARHIARAGMLVGAGLLVPIAAHSLWHPEGMDFPLAGASVGLALVMVALALWVWHQAMLRGRIAAEVARGNAAAGVAVAGHYVSACLVAKHCFVADSLDALWMGVVFFAASEAALVGLSILFRCLTYYADDQEILGENMAAAVSYAGVVVALSVVVAHAVDGSFVGWWPALRSFGVFLLLSFSLYPFRQIVVGRLLLGYPLAFRGGPLDRAVAQDRNVVVSLVEALGYLAVAFLVTGFA